MRVVGTPFTFPQRYTTKWKLQADVLGTFVIEKVRNNVEAPDKSEFSPALIVGYKPFSNQDLNLRAFYKRIFHFPRFRAVANAAQVV